MSAPSSAFVREAATPAGPGKGTRNPEPVTASSVAGTVEYMSPEQLDGKVDVRTELGVRPRGGNPGRAGEGDTEPRTGDRQQRGRDGGVHVAGAAGRQGRCPHRARRSSARRQPRPGRGRGHGTQNR